MIQLYMNMERTIELLITSSKYQFKVPNDTNQLLMSQTRREKSRKGREREERGGELTSEKSVNLKTYMEDKHVALI